MEEMNERYKAAIDRGLARFAAENVQCKAAIASVSKAAAEAVGSSLEEAQYLETWRIARLQAGAKGMEADDFILSLGADAEEASQLRAHQRKKIAQAIGLDDLL
ncbi:MAG TPA: hypothetical protein DDZ58_08545 [Achromobacter sp.]|nr:hypothetical protein [Achromobacter sp.]